MIEIVTVEGNLGTYWEVRVNGKWVYQTSISMTDAAQRADELRKEQGDVHSG